MSGPGQRILVVEDDENLRIALADNLESEGYAVEVAASGSEALGCCSESDFDLIVLDLMLPDTDGYALCRTLREKHAAARILMLTARALEEDMVRGFDVGADDYVTKPYRLAVLLARVRALLRRGAFSQDRTSRFVLFGHFRLDRSSRVVSGPEGPVALTRKEFDLLLYLLENPGRAIGRQQILEDVWGTDVVVDERTVDNFVSSLKKKLCWTADSGFRIATVRGVGYRMELEPE